MSQLQIQLEAGGLVLAKSKVDEETTEQIVARTYHHPALGRRSVVRLATDRLGKAEDLAMEFLGFETPEVSPPIGIQQRRSLGFGAWALMNDPTNAQYALDLVKRMKAGARLAKSKPGHAWDAFTEMAKELGRSARQFLPPYWEEVGRAYKDLGNQTYAGRALNKSLEAERVHALASDQARRRDVVLEFVLAGCLAGQALSDYGNDLQTHYKPAEAYTIFRDLCTRRTRGGMSPWATMPREFLKISKAAGLNADAELEKWLEEIIDSPAMARPPQQFWKSCSPHCKRIVSRNPTFAIALLRHTKPETRLYGESPVWAWLDLLESWGVFEFLWKEGHRDAPPLGEPAANWFTRIICQQVPAPRRVLEMLVQLAPRLKVEAVPLQLVPARHHGCIDIDVLEGCFSLGIAVADPPKQHHFTISFDGWLSSTLDHPLRNQDLFKSWQDERFASHVEHGFQQALRCRGTAAKTQYGRPEVGRRPFPVAANDRPGIKELWRKYTANSIAQLEISAVPSFEHTTGDQLDTLWPDALRLFPDLTDRYNKIDPVDSLHRTLKAGIFDEYGWPALEELIQTSGLEIKADHQQQRQNLFLSYPHLVLTDSIHAYVIRNGIETKKYELRLPKKVTLTSAYVVGDDLAIEFQGENYKSMFYWVSDPDTVYEGEGYCFRYGRTVNGSTVLPDGNVFFGGNSVRPGEKRLPDCQEYLHDGSRFWRLSFHFDQPLQIYRCKVQEVDSLSGKPIRESVPAWFEEAEGDIVDWQRAQLMPAPAGMNDSPMGTKDGMTGWKPVWRRDGVMHGQGIDGRACAFRDEGGTQLLGMLRQPGADEFLSVIRSGPARQSDTCYLLDPTGTTIVSELRPYNLQFAWGQVTVLPVP